MIILLWLLLAAVPWLIGAGVLAVLYRKPASPVRMTDAWITGGLCCIGVAEVLHLLGTFGQLPLSRLVLLWHGVMAVLCIAALLLVALTCRKQKERFQILPERGGSFVLPGIFLLMVLIQTVYVYCMPAVATAGDITAETLHSFQAADGIYLVNPLTGQAYTQGLSLRYRILGLPTLYTILATAFQVEGTLFVQNLIPVVVLAGTYMVYYRLARLLFGNDLRKKYLFLILVALIFWCGEGAVWLDGYGALHSAWLGTSIRNLILLPYALSLGLEKDLRHTWPGMLLCVLAEASICWTFNGLGLCLALLVILAVLDQIGSSGWFRRLTSRIPGRKEERP
ncbi:MAG: hypothetical protein J6B43_03365 [Lachnospiraceae bacterium]|nr:hypothetical protein [Lachnospiraceae bacterium]